MREFHTLEEFLDLDPALRRDDNSSPAQETEVVPVDPKYAEDVLSLLTQLGVKIEDPESEATGSRRVVEALKVPLQVVLSHLPL